MQLVFGTVLAAAILLPIDAAAQTPSMPRWDTGASFGLMWGDGLESDDQPYTDDDAAAFQFDIGRYWTSHFKTELSATLRPATDTWSYAPYPVVPGGYAYTRHEHETTIFSGAVAWQFFDNEMMHPFVAGGLHVAHQRTHRFRTEQIYTINRASYLVPALDERSVDVLVRPFVAVGAKSYFNRQTFVRSELLAAVGARGFSHAVLRLGLGVDF